MMIVNHPGPRAACRVLTMQVARRPKQPLRVNEGEDLLGAVRHFVDRHEASGACYQLIRGTIGSLSIMTGRPAQAPMVAEFAGPYVIGCPAQIVAGSGNLGLGSDGKRVSHCHAAFRDQRGSLVGGHLIEGACIAGSGGLLLDVAILNGGHFVQQADAETGFTLFYPEGASSIQPSSVMLKLQPNQDVTFALEAACREVGIDRAVICSAVGSLNEAVIEDEDGKEHLIEGPGLEVAGLLGEVKVGEALGPSTLHAFVCRADGTAVGGRIVRGRNPICVTFEVVLDVSEKLK